LLRLFGDAMMAARGDIMIGRQELQQQLFSAVQIDSFIPQNHLLRKIDKVLDFEFVREMTEHLYCADNGRPSVDPVLFFRIYLIIFLYGIESDRQACDEICYNLAYRWFCRLSLEDSVPDHSSLTKIRDRLGEETFKKIFEKIINVCIEKNLVKGTKVMMDGSIVKADAALRSMVDRPKDGEKLEDMVPPKYIKDRRLGNKTQVSKTDPECALAGKVGETKKLAYKVHDTIDRDSRVIIDAHVTTGAELEGKVMMSRVDHIEKTFAVKVEEITADRGYGYGDNLQAMQDREIHAFVPRFHSKAGERVARDSVGFEFDRKRDCYICPKGHEMYPIKGAIPEYKKYRIKGGHCSKCPLKETCLTIPTMRTRNAKHIEVHHHQEIIDKTAKMEKTEEFKKARGERQWKMEGTFAEAKVNHGLDRARYRGRSKMQIQAYMIATVQNLKRLIGLTPWLKSFLENLIENIEKFFLRKIASNFYRPELKSA
jgi:transposase